MSLINKEPDNDKKKCLCSTNMGLFIPNRRLSLVTAGGILSIFITFIIGYFTGQHTAVESFTNKIEQESFSDQIYASLFTPYKTTKEISEQESDENFAEITNKEDEAIENHTTENIAQLDDKLVEQEASLLPQEQYYAQLIGFGTERAAQKFAHKLESQNISVKVNKRRSKTAKGKTVLWYQVVTQEYNNKDELRELIDRIEKTEKIKGAQIISC